MTTHLNDALEFDAVRWSIGLETSKYDAAKSFQTPPQKTLLPPRTRLYRLVYIANGRYFDEVWWMPKRTFDELHEDANRSQHGGGRLFRNYIAQFMSLPSGSHQMSIVEIELTESVYAWIGKTAPLAGRPGGMEQVFLPNLADRGSPRTSAYARILHTYWLKF